MNYLGDFIFRGRGRGGNMTSTNKNLTKGSNVQHDPWTKYGVLGMLAIALIGYMANYFTYQAKLDNLDKNFSEYKSETKDSFKELKVEVKEIKDKMATKEDIDRLIKAMEVSKK